MTFSAEEVRKVAAQMWVEGSTVEKMLLAFAAILEQCEAVIDEDRTCETCGGLGTIDETLGGIHTSNPKAECPDCCGVGEYAQPETWQVPDELEAYDAGLLNDFGGGNVEWWWDYIREELGRAHGFYQSQLAAAPSAPTGE